MDLITIEEVEDALGPSEDPLATARYISGLSEYINDYCTTSFELIEDDTKRLMMDVKGEVTLPGAPVISISNIIDPRWNQPDLYIDWDLIGTLYYGLPNQVIDVTYTHGLDGAPQEIKDLIISGIASIIGDVAGGGSPITEFQVGDVLEKYGSNAGFIAQFFGSQAALVLAKYGGGTAFTVEVAADRYYPNYRGNRAYLDD